MSLAEYRRSIEDLLHRFLWKQWSQLGVAGTAPEEDRWIIDPEALLLFTLEAARTEPRLFDEVLDWLLINGHAIDVQRLRNLLGADKQYPVGILAAVALVLSEEDSSAKWKRLSGQAESTSSPEPLFQLETKGPLQLKSRDPRFERIGYLRSPFVPRRMSQAPSVTSISTLRLRLRAFFGIGIRAEAVAYLLVHQEGHTEEIARSIAYSFPGVQQVLREMAGSGLLHSRRVGREKVYWVEPSRWWPFLQPGGLSGLLSPAQRKGATEIGTDQEFLALKGYTGEQRDHRAEEMIFQLQRPNLWIEWGRLLRGLSVVLRTLRRPGLEEQKEYLQASELRIALEHVAEDVEGAGFEFKLPSQDTRNVQPYVAQALEEVRSFILTLSKGTPRLFDQIERTERRYMREHESSFEFVNSSAKEDMAWKRQAFEQWFEHFPDEGKPDVRGRFRDNDNFQHLSAIFELYLSELMHSLNYEVAIHPLPPDSGGTRPDFLVRKDKLAFYLEATLARPGQEKAKGDKRISQVYQTLERIDSPNFYLTWESQGVPQTPPSGAELRRELERWLATLNPDEESARYASKGFEALPTKTWSHEGWRVVFKAVPREPERRGKGGRPLGPRVETLLMDTETRIKGAVAEKANRYGELELPYVVAVNVLDQTVDDYDVMGALFGEDAPTVLMDHRGAIKGTQQHRMPNGVWFGPEGSRNRGLSALLVCNVQGPFDARQRTPRLFHNPWARNPFPLDAWPLPQMIPDAEKNRLVARPGLEAAEVLSFPKLVS